MNTARLNVRHAAAVSAGALVLCLSGAATAYADPLPSAPGLPSPDNVITTLDQTVTQLTGTDPGLAPPPTTTPPTTTPPTTTPPSTTPQQAPATGTGTGTGKPRVTAPKAATRHVTVRPATAHPVSASNVSWTAPAGATLSLPAATGVATVAGSAPAVAPLLIPQVTQRITPAAVTLEADKHTGSPVRGILLTLAIAAAVALGYEHGRLARQGAAA